MNGPERPETIKLAPRIASQCRYDLIVIELSVQYDSNVKKLQYDNDRKVSRLHQDKSGPKYQSTMPGPECPKITSMKASIASARRHALTRKSRKDYSERHIPGGVHFNKNL